MEQYKIVVLDDDPTGIQTVHGVYVYTDWSEESIRAGFGRRKTDVFTWIPEIDCQCGRVSGSGGVCCRL